VLDEPFLLLWPRDNLKQLAFAHSQIANAQVVEMASKLFLTSILVFFPCTPSFPFQSLRLLDNQSCLFKQALPRLLVLSCR
jgi:hypothetical protein